MRIWPCENGTKYLQYHLSIVRNQVSCYDYFTWEFDTCFNAILVTHA